MSNNTKQNARDNCRYGAFKPDKYHQQYGLDAAEQAAGPQGAYMFRGVKEDTLAQAAAYALASPTFAPKALSAINLLPVPIRLAVAHYLMATLAIDVGNAAFGYGTTLPARREDEDEKETRVFVCVGVGEGLYKFGGEMYREMASEQDVADQAMGWVPKDFTGKRADEMFVSLYGRQAFDKAMSSIRGRYVNVRKPAGTSLVKALAPFGFCEGFVRTLKNDQAMGLLSSCLMADEGEAGILKDGITPEELAGSRKVIAMAAADVAKARRDHDQWHVLNRRGGDEKKAEPSGKFDPADVPEPSGE
jgi:hypothetical protein